MIVGVPRETHQHEHRVGLNPFAVARLSKRGHTVLVEDRAGDAARFSMQRYQEAGARIVYGPEEVYQRADVVCRVGQLAGDEIDYLKRGSIICSFHHLAVAKRRTVDRLMEHEATLIGYEIVQDDRGNRPILLPFSEMGGRMAVHLGAQYLQNEAGGRGILLGNVLGVPPPTVLILGAGAVGSAASRQAVGSGAHVVVLDADVRKLRELHRELGGAVATSVVAMERLERYTAIADLIIGAVLIPGERAPFLVTEEMVKAMRAGSVIIDVSIDQGGCVETSRPTTLADPTFVVHDVVHYCVPNMTANVARTASRALGSAVFTYIERIAGVGLEAALRADPGLARGVYLYRGKMVNEGAAGTLRIPVTPLSELMQEVGRP